MRSDIYVIITAGGVGKRMGAGIAKQFLELDGIPIILHTINFFRSLPFDSEILLVLPSQYKEYWKNYCRENSLWFRHTLVTGGITRFHSVRNALKYVPEDSIVMVHDGVRPFLDAGMVDRLLGFRNSTDPEMAGAIPVIPAVDSMREKVSETVSRIVDRSKYMMVQTPQVFYSSKLKDSYSQAYSPLFTDDASVVESAGYKVMTVEGSRSNIKITAPQDLAIGAAILKYNSESR